MSALAGRIEPLSLPFEEGDPERGELWSPGGAPPSGLEFLGCRGTLACWFAPCPACCRGWVPVVPDGTRFGYRTAVEIGCSAGCEALDVAWWHAWKMGDMPPLDPVDERQRRYARGAVRRVLADVMAGGEVLAAAAKAGSFAEAAGLPIAALAGAFANTANAPAVDVLRHMLIGAAKPARLPDAA